MDNAGCPVIYEADGFEIVSSNLDGYCLAEDDDGDITIAHKLIFEAKLNNFWEAYFENPTHKERALLENVIKDLSFREGRRDVAHPPSRGPHGQAAVLGRIFLYCFRHNRSYCSEQERCLQQDADTRLLPYREL